MCGLKLKFIESFTEKSSFNFDKVHLSNFLFISDRACGNKSKYFTSALGPKEFLLCIFLKVLQFCILHISP